MRSRGLLLLSLVLALGCQDKKPDASTPATGTTAPAATATTTEPAPAVPAPAPLDGTIEGKPFRPAAVSLEGLRDVALLIFRQTADIRAPNIQIQLPVTETENVGGREWTFG